MFLLLKKLSKYYTVPRCQLSGDPESTQHTILFFCAAVRVAPFGIEPSMMALRMRDALPDTWAWEVKGPGPLPLPALWQPEIAHDEAMIGFTSVAKDFTIDPQSGTKSVFFLHALTVNNTAINPIIKLFTITDNFIRPSTSCFWIEAELLPYCIF
jgi:hypothetical protein